MAELSDAGCIYQNMEGIETLAGIDTICVDNSGVFTENRYILARPHCISCDPEDIILAASVSAPQEDSHHPLERAIAKALKQFPQAKAKRDRYKTIDHQDVHSDTGGWYTQYLVEAPDGTRTFFARGAVRALFGLCRKTVPTDDTFEETMKQAVTDFREKGLLSLGIAQRQEGGNWQFLGALPFCNPPRQSTRSALEQADKLGVRVKVMSGWTGALVDKTARAAGLKTSLLSADTIDQFQKNPSAELAAQINEANVYTELDNKHREIILTALQNSGH